MAFWLKRSQGECWETSIGQEVYRLILVDFFITIIGTSLAEFVRFRIFKTHWKRLGAPEFDVARNTLNLIYNQTLFFVGFYFSPLLAAVIVIKMFIMFYIRKVGVLRNCVPSHRTWRAAQTQTLFLGLAFLSSLGVIILLVYIMTKVQASDCGPFRGYPYMYQMILEGVLNLKQGSNFLNVILFLVKPGVVAGVLVAMCMTVYYMRAKAQAHTKMVDILRVMLVSEAKDKEFLLSYISRVTEGKWMYNLHKHSELPRQSKQGGDFMRGSRMSKLPQSPSSSAADRASIFSAKEAVAGLSHRSSTNLENRTNVYRPSPNMRQQNRSVGAGLQDRYNHSNERLQDRSLHL